MLKSHIQQQFNKMLTQKPSSTVSQHLCPGVQHSCSCLWPKSGLSPRGSLAVKSPDCGENENRKSLLLRWQLSDNYHRQKLSTAGCWDGCCHHRWWHSWRSCRDDLPAPVQNQICGLHVKCPPQAHILEPFCFNRSPEQRLLLIFYGTSFYNFICI